MSPGWRFCANASSSLYSRSDVSSRCFVDLIQKYFQISCGTDQLVCRGEIRIRRVSKRVGKLFTRFEQIPKNGLIRGIRARVICNKHAPAKSRAG